jgi:hypothetical protein
MTRKACTSSFQQLLDRRSGGFTSTGTGLANEKAFRNLAIADPFRLLRNRLYEAGLITFTPQDYEIFPGQQFGTCPACL